LARVLKALAKIEHRRSIFAPEPGLSFDILARILGHFSIIGSEE
jgi:hypothetical protein